MCGGCLDEPVGVAWAWRLQERERPGAGQDPVARLGATWSAWFFPHGSFPVLSNEWLPTGLWPWPRLKEYTYQGPEYTPQPASQPASWPLNTPNHQSTCYELAPSHAVTSAATKKNDSIFNGGENILFVLGDNS